jgi:AcrR family transcriptional regulator
MTEPVKPRRYSSPLREQTAEQTRRAILDAAHARLTEHGYAGLTMRAVAADAGVALDTVYAAVGRKPVLVRLLIETAISGTDTAVAAAERDYVQQIRAADNARDKLALYAAAVTRIHQRLAPLVSALRAAAPSHPELAALWTEIAGRRARNMRAFADDLLATNELRSDLNRERIADIIWSMNAPEYYTLLTHDRGWTPDQFQHWLTEAWTRLLLDNPV